MATDALSMELRRTRSAIATTFHRGGKLESEPLPGTLDRVMTSLVKAFTRASTQQRLAFPAALSGSERSLLCAYAHRMSTLARRTGNSSFLVDAVIALGIAAPGSDPRAILRSLTLPCDTADKIGVEAHAIVAEAAR